MRDKIWSKVYNYIHYQHAEINCAVVEKQCCESFVTLIKFSLNYLPIITW